jgi:hypothetical protein
LKSRAFPKLICRFTELAKLADSKGDLRVKRILYISGSLGLGHVGRDIEIAGALRKLRPDIEVSWMAESPASDVLEKAGEKLLPEALEFAHARFR